MPKPKRGEIWLLRFPFTDLATVKLRPALVWAIHREDLIVLGIFSKIPSTAVRKTWVRIEDQHPEFAQTGLQKTSLVKAEKIAVVHESVLQRKLGRLPRDLMPHIEEALKKALLIS